MRAFCVAFATVFAAALVDVPALMPGPANAQSSDHLDALNRQVQQLYEEGKFAEALSIAERYVVAAKKLQGEDHSEYATAISVLATLLKDANRLAEAEPLVRRALAINEKSFGPDDPTVATDLNNLAQLLQATNRLVESEPLMRRALAIDEKSAGPDHPDVAIRLNNLAVLLHDTNRSREAEPLMRRALAIAEKSFGPDHPDVAIRLNNLAVLLQDTNRSGEAEPLMRRALAIGEKSFGPDHPYVARDLNNLAQLLQATNRLAEAEALMRRALAIDEKSFGPDHPNVATDLNNLGMLLKEADRLAEAEPLMGRAIPILEKSLGAAHPKVALALGNLAVLLAERGDWVEAIALHGRAKPILIARDDSDGSDRAGLAKAALSGNTWMLRSYARALHRADAGSNSAREEGFELAQWALQTGAADALAQMSLRFAKGPGELAGLVRQLQDLLARRQGEVRRLDAAAGSADAKVADRARTVIAALDKQLDAIDARLAAEFPEFAELSNPRPLTIAAAQALLRSDEALVIFLDVPQLGKLPEEGLAWVVTKTDVRWLRLSLTPSQITAHVAALRCGLDHTRWTEVGNAGSCKAALKAAPGEEIVKIASKDVPVQVLPFDVARAHELYKALLGPVDDLIKGKHLLVVPSGPLSSLPFHVLVTEAPKTAIPASFADYRSVAWLSVRQPITVLPSVVSLKSLRQFAKASRATKRYLGVGNPLLEGPDTTHDKRAQLARDKQTCPKTWGHRIALAAGQPLTSFAKLFRGANADIEELRRFSPLPETADELCEVGRRLGVAESEILLGSRATEAALKDLSETGRLAEYAILHFATHGALTGQVQGVAEPGLILTPPAKGTSDPKALERDDGFLTASEIATLTLDADWVVLSACNTAGASGETAEALSCMARAFFYAGARSLLVSHWEVGSAAAVKLTTRAFAELKARPAVGRAEAFRISMRELMEKGTPFEAHPSQWAPFVVVGEGAR